MKDERMKGQFFLIGAFLILMLFYAGIASYFTPDYAGPGIRAEAANLFGNIRDEYPAALNLGLNSTGAAAALMDFSRIAVNATEARGADLKVLWILTENVSGDVNVTAGNFLGEAVSVELEISGVTSTLNLDSEAAGSVIFASPPSEFTLRASFNTTEKNLLLEKYKANLYVILEMAKGSDKMVGETFA